MNKLEIIELKPLRRWNEREGNRLLDSIRIYVGELHIGTCYRKRYDSDLYRFHGMDYSITTYITSQYKTLEEIEEEIILSLKEHCRKFLKVYKILKSKK